MWVLEELKEKKWSMDIQIKQYMISVAFGKDQTILIEIFQKLNVH